MIPLLGHFLRPTLCQRTASVRLQTTTRLITSLCYHNPTILSHKSTGTVISGSSGQNRFPVLSVTFRGLLSSSDTRKQPSIRLYSSQASEAEVEKTNVDHSRFIAEGSPQSEWRKHHKVKSTTTTTNQEEEEEWNSIPEGRGKLSPTSSHLFKLILPLGHLSAQQTAHNGSKENPVPPTVFLLHPSQPLSHVSRLISASLAPSTPTIAFRSAPNADWDKQAFQWSDATDVGDFVRDAARATEFIIHIANARVSEASKDSGPSNAEIVVDVPTFTDRTRFLRRQLEVIGDEMKGMEGLKLMCDREAHRGARRLAVSGFFGLVVYWGTVARLTFWDLGWDIMEPVTYLSGLSMVICGYLWFLYQGREVSYSSVLDRSISARREALYKQHGFDIDRWLELVGEAKQVRSEISKIARDYDNYRGDPRGSEEVPSKLKEKGSSRDHKEPAEGKEEKEANLQGKTEGERVKDEAEGNGTLLTEENSRIR